MKFRNIMEERLNNAASEVKNAQNSQNELDEHKQILDIPETEDVQRESRAEELREGTELSIPRPKEDRELELRLSQANHKQRLEIPKNVKEAHEDAGYHLAWVRYLLGGQVDVSSLSKAMNEKGYEFVPAVRSQAGKLVDYATNHAGEDIILINDCVLMRTRKAPYEARMKNIADKSRKQTQQIDEVMKSQGVLKSRETRSKVTKGSEPNKMTFDSDN